MTIHAPLGAQVKTPPPDASVFEYPASLRIMMLVVTLLCVGFITFALVMQLIRPAPGSLITVFLALVVFGTGTVFSFRTMRYTRDRIVVNPEGIWYLAKNGPSSYMTWLDVTSVKADDTMQRLILTDASGTRIIRIEYQIGSFKALREFILSHANSLALQAPVGTREFHRTWINKIILSALGLPLLIIAVQCYRERSTDGFHVACALGTGLLLLILLDPVGITIQPNGILIGYPLWKRSISFDSITEIRLQDVSSRGNVWAAVVIERKQRRPIRLFRFREGSIALKDALQSAWHRSQNGRIEDATQSPMLAD
ncbi:MAG: hypothetical protein KGL64_09095 [Acidobacteriota bacterium]|nr:hypothetical protein [Acidobacteriota bacterium]